MTSYLTENEKIRLRIPAKNVQNGNVLLVQIADFGIKYLENYSAH